MCQICQPLSYLKNKVQEVYRCGSRKYHAVSGDCFESQSATGCHPYVSAGLKVSWFNSLWPCDAI